MITRMSNHPPVWAATCRPLLVMAAIILTTATVANVFAQGQDLPKIAVYVTGDVSENEKSVLGTRMLASLIRSGRYQGIERSGSFLAEIEKEQMKQRSGTIDDSQISELGRQFGVKYVCIANLTPAFGSFQLSARIVNVETAVVEFIGEAFSSLESAKELTEVSDRVVREMFGELAKHEPKSEAPRPPVIADKEDLEPAPETKPEPKSEAPHPPVIADKVNLKPAPKTKPEPKPEEPRPPVLTDKVNLEPAPKTKSIKKSFWLGLGMDIAGAGIIAYGLYENSNVIKYDNDGVGSKAEKSANIRNAAYIAGTAVLLSGISIHIFF